MTPSSNYKNAVADVLRLRDIDCHQLAQIFAPHGLMLQLVESGLEIPGSHWGDDEAGLIRHQLFARLDTPVHSALHEGCHFLLMDEQRRQILHTDAGGTAVEENAVCYLQILLSERVTGMGRRRMMQDMDVWGYSFRLGSAAAWFESDAEDAIELLVQKGLVERDFSGMYQPAELTDATVL